ncbi:CEP295 N-terminal-like protein [Myotis lucifugus]|uniref:CEP295 N-terminal-like protein n=1 Tax=Myotis lucifugus TaxID=59463 RepID=UPI0003C4371E|nr:CEP295 N-terminal-like protein [Myotis lucifugus]
MDLAPGPAQEDACPAAPSANVKEILCQLKDRQYRKLVEPLLSDEGYLAPHPEEESPLWCGLRPRHEPPRPDMLLSQLRPPAQVGRARSEPAWPKQSREQRWRPKLVEVHELPQLSWEALGRPPMEPGEMTETETEPETGPQMSARPARVTARVTGPPSPDLEEARGCERSTAAPPAASSEEEDDNDSTPSQMIRDLEEQILEQNKSHKQFLEQARRRLQEFQSMC